MASNSNTHKSHVVVIGAGVIGLTTAIKLQREGSYRVSIVAEQLPSEPKSIRYTSHWAGAHHVSFANFDQAQQDIDDETFKIMWEMSEPGSKTEHCFLRVLQVECSTRDLQGPSPLGFMPDFEYLNPEEVPNGAKSGVRFTTLNIDTPVYLRWLEDTFVENGGTFVKKTLKHISDVLEIDTLLECDGTIDAIIVCPGIGARDLGGVEDKSVYPVRGQTVLVKAPWVKSGVTLRDPEGSPTYVIARRSGDVVVGGTSEKDDWEPNPRPETTEDILRRALALFPGLAPPDINNRRNPESSPSVEDIRPFIIETGCGLRPARTGGARIEQSSLECASGGAEITVVFNYGHGGAGYQSSWGSASQVLKLLKKGAVAEGGSGFEKNSA